MGESHKFRRGDKFTAGGTKGYVMDMGTKDYSVYFDGFGSSSIPFEVFDDIAVKVRQPFKLGDHITPADSGGCYQDERVVLSEDDGRIQYVRRTKGAVRYDNIIYQGGADDFELA